MKQQWWTSSSTSVSVLLFLLWSTRFLLTSWRKSWLSQWRRGSSTATSKVTTLVSDISEKCLRRQRSEVPCDWSLIPRPSSSTVSDLQISLFTIFINELYSKQNLKPLTAMNHFLCCCAVVCTGAMWCCPVLCMLNLRKQSVSHSSTATR